MQRVPIAILMLVVAPRAWAGMPSFSISEMADLRLRGISFFAVVFLLSALGIKLLWNALQKDFTSLPRLSYPKALGLTALVGLLFMCVLTMISGARELMTPGAWRKNGATYELSDAPAKPGPVNERLQTLGAALTKYAQARGVLPLHDYVEDIPRAVWIADERGRRFIYCGGGFDPKQDPNRIVAFEPGDIAGDRWVLRASGKVEAVPEDTLKAQAEALRKAADQAKATAQPDKKKSE